MQLSIIVPIYREVEAWTDFFASLEKQSDHNFELILVVDTHLNNPLKAIGEHYQSAKDFWSDRLKIIFNSRRLGRTDAIKLGINQAVGEYTLILSISDEIAPNFMTRVNKILTSDSADIIEFDIYARKPVRFKWQPNSSFSTITKVADNKSLFALAAPFEFNKFFRSTLLKKAARLKLNATTNSRYSIEHTYTALILAETYLAVHERLVVTHTRISLNFDPIKLLRQWKALLSFLNESLSGDFYNEWAFAFANTQVSFVSKAVKETKRAFRHKYHEAVRKEFKALQANSIFYFHDNPKLVNAIGKY